MSNAASKKPQTFSGSDSDYSFEALIESLSVGVNFCDAEERFLFANRALAQMTGYARDEMIGRTTYEIMIPEDQAAIIKERVRTRLEGTPERYEVQLRRKDGSRFWAHISAAPISDAFGSVVGSVAIIEDISDRKADAEALARAEEGSRKLQGQLLQSQKMEAIGQLAAGIAHDLNNSLGAVVGHLQLMRLMPDVSPAVHSSIDIALGGCERSSGLIKQLLGFARQGKYNFRCIALPQLLSETVTFLSQIIGKDISIVQEPVTEQYNTRADDAQIQQVFINLMLNAKHAMSRGGTIHISFRREEVSRPERFNPQAVPGRFIVIEVQDTGEGISAERLSKIFEPFYSTRAEGHGSGLGLAMVYGIMQSHDGWVSVESEVGHGSCFSLFFPEATELPDTESAPTHTPVLAGAGKVLVIDDEPELVDLAQRFLEHRGIESIGFCNGLEAVVWYSHHYNEIDLVVLDMKMPGMDGAACFRSLREVNPEVVVVLMTGYVHDDEADNLLKAGARKFFQKPLKYPALVEWVCEELRRTE